MGQEPSTSRWIGVFREGGLRRNGQAGGWKRLVLLLLFLGFSVLAVSQFTSAREFGLTMGTGVWYWGLLSAVLFFVYFFLFALVYRIGLAIVDVKTTAQHMLPVLCSSIFINTVVPIGAAAGGAVFVVVAVSSRILKVWVPLTAGYFFTCRMRVFQPRQQPVVLVGVEEGQTL